VPRSSTAVLPAPHHYIGTVCFSVACKPLLSCIIAAYNASCSLLPLLASLVHRINVACCATCTASPLLVLQPCIAYPIWNNGTS
jgi:hypothetical protein